MRKKLILLIHAVFIFSLSKPISAIEASFNIEIIRGSSPELFETSSSDGELSHGYETDFKDVKEIEVEPEQMVYYLKPEDYGQLVAAKKEVKPEDYGQLVVAKKEAGLLRAILACLRCRRK